MNSARHNCVVLLKELPWEDWHGVIQVAAPVKVASGDWDFFEPFIRRLLDRTAPRIDAGDTANYLVAVAYYDGVTWRRQVWANQTGALSEGRGQSRELTAVMTLAYVLGGKGDLAERYFEPDRNGPMGQLEADRLSRSRKK